MTAARPRRRALVAVLFVALIAAAALLTLRGREAAPPAVAPVGIVAGAVPDPALAARLHARLVRFEWDISTPVARMTPTIAAYARRGIRVLPLAGFYRRLPGYRDVHNLERWARAFGPGGTFWRGRRDGHLAIRDIEFGNETAMSYQFTDNSPAAYHARAVRYARRAVQALRAIRRSGRHVGLLLQGDPGDRSDDAWVSTVLGSRPVLAKAAAGWTVHPYGPQWRERVARALRQLRDNGVASPALWVTEWGLATDGGSCLSDNYGWDRCMTFNQAANTLTRVVRGLQLRYGRRLALVAIYTVRDQAEPGATRSREAYFGALDANGHAKGAYTTAVQSLLGKSGG